MIGSSNGRSPVIRCSSEWHRPDAAILTSTSPALGGIELDLLHVPRGVDLPQDGGLGLHSVYPHTIQDLRTSSTVSTPTGVDAIALRPLARGLRSGRDPCQTTFWAHPVPPVVTECAQIAGGSGGTGPVGSPPPVHPLIRPSECFVRVAPAGNTPMRRNTRMGTTAGHGPAGEHAVDGRVPVDVLGRATGGPDAGPFGGQLGGQGDDLVGEQLAGVVAQATGQRRAGAAGADGHRRAARCGRSPAG